jgi:hypothetical protein
MFARGGLMKSPALERRLLVREFELEAIEAAAFNSPRGAARRVRHAC